ncbi:non-ribosomal peptide synthetase [Microbulbifer sp. GL-2]|uniref:non-ribosomal peptide synthetase n=1 Tax=Microbulbifer sp. GL-2 TaxID=2591606 RepID=UPI0011657BBD|nr:non-ribosomal peptide synthetase [Microbulbifer sp. GL-2]BBM00783.1 hypothetical protein GL2_08570 [Microbulbifer sp. GL-2]
MSIDSSDKPSGNSHTFELLPAQKDIFLDQQVFKDVPLYNIGGYVEFRGNLDIDSLISAHHILMSSADIFSLRVRASTQGVEQFSSTPPDKLDFKDFSRNDDPQSAALSHITISYQKPFSLDGPSLFRIGILHLEKNRYWYYGIAHHVLLDGWGFSNWVQALTNIYNQISENRECDYSNIPFLSILPDEMEYLESHRYKNDRKYWLDRFSNFPQKLMNEKYPHARTGLTAKSGRVLRQIDQERFSIHREYAQSQGVSVVQLYLAALYIYYSCTTGNDDIVFGIPIHNRRSQISKKVIGTLLSVCPTRLKFSPSQSGRNLIAGILKLQRQDLRHQRYPISHLSSDLELRSKGLARLFDVSFNYQLLDYSVQIPGLSVKTTYLTNNFEQTPLTFTICDYGQQQDIELQLDFNHVYMNQVEANLMMSRWLSIVEQLIENDECAICDYQLVSADDWKILKSVNPPPTPITSDLLSLLEAQALRYPHQSAVEFEGGELTYRALIDKVDNMAANLLDFGVSSGSRVGVCLPRSSDLLIAFLAVLKAGASYVPLDPEFPEKRLFLMDEIARLNLVISDNSNKENVGSINFGDDRRVISIGSLKEGRSQGRNIFPTRKADDAAYILFTSGSTGVPKGVEVTHEALINFLLSMKQNPGFSGSDRLLAVTTTSFDIAGLELYLPLICGGTVVIASSSSVKSGPLLSELIRAKKISVMQATPATWKMMLEAGWEGSGKLKILCGGEALPGSLASNLLQRSQSLWNMYGPTETTIWSSVKRIEHENNINIGHPIQNTTVFVLDDKRRQVPIGERGKLYIGGKGLAKGYFDRPDLTAERFSNWNDRDGRQHYLYNTGDLARVNEKGELEYLGRNDFQIKLRGYRIEVTDVEASIISFPAVTDCLVDLRQRVTDPSTEFLAAYYTANRIIDDQELRSHLSERLPAYMIPTAFVPLNSFKLTLNGKKDRTALPQPSANNLIRRQRRKPNDELEAKIVKVWLEILGVEEICVEQNLFEQGVTSLDMVRAGKILEERFDKSLTTVNLFEYPNIRALAQHFNNSSQDQESTAPETKKENKLLARRARVSDEASI